MNYNNSIFQTIDINSFITRLNVCEPNWGETNCIYGYNKFYYFLDGETTIKIDNDIFHPEPEELFLIPANIMHTYFHNPKNPVYKYWCHFDLSLAEGQKLIYSKNTIKCKISKSRITPLFDKMINLNHSTLPLDALVEKSTLLTLLKMFLDNIDLDKILPSSPNHFTNIINNYIKKNIVREITIKQLADIVHVHPNYFIKLFKEHFSVTPIEYINSIRLHYATTLMTKDKNKNISNISYMVGFNDYRYFTRLFKKKYGITPSAYKKI